MSHSLIFTRILLIDDHAMFRSGLRMVLSSEIPNVEVFEANSVGEAINRSPDNMNVVLLDIQLKGSSGLEGISLLKEKWPLAYILMLSSQDDTETVHMVIEHGADGFVSKAETANKMVETIKLILGNQMAGQYTTSKTTQRLLTPRQREVLNLLYQGMSNKLIARQLLLSDNTVRRHVQDILEYFQVSNRAEAVFAAQRQHLVG